jgi:hypothetical protein
MKKLIIPALAFTVLLSSCHKQSYEGAVIGGAAGSAVGAILDEENPWRGAFIGGVIGAVVTGSIVEIASRAADECAEYGKPIEYRCYKCRENIRIVATPVGWKGKCRIVRIKYFKGNKLIKVKTKKVCKKHKKVPPPFREGWVPPGHRF